MYEMAALLLSHYSHDAACFFSLLICKIECIDIITGDETSFYVTQSVDESINISTGVCCSVASL